MFIVTQKRGDTEFYMTGRNEFSPDLDKAQEFPTEHDAQWGIWTVPEAAWRRMCKVGPAERCWTCGGMAANPQAEEMDRRCGTCPVANDEPAGDDPILGMGYSSMYGGYK